MWHLTERQCAYKNECRWCRAVISPIFESLFFPLKCRVVTLSTVMVVNIYWYKTFRWLDFLELNLKKQTYVSDPKKQKIRITNGYSYKYIRNSKNFAFNLFWTIGREKRYFLKTLRRFCILVLKRFQKVRWIWK